MRWISEHAAYVGGRSGPVAVAGWSAGGNVAAVTCQQACDLGGPQIVGQLLLTPVTDCDLTRASYAENESGYILTTPLMEWFWGPLCRPLATLTAPGFAAPDIRPDQVAAGMHRHL